MQWLGFPSIYTIGPPVGDMHNDPSFSKLFFMFTNGKQNLLNNYITHEILNKKIIKQFI